MAAVTVTPATPQAGSRVTVAGSAFTASTSYLVTIQQTTPSGTSDIGEFKITTDGAGAFTRDFPLKGNQFNGATYTVNVYASPAAESSVTTTPVLFTAISAAATTTFTEGPPSS